MARLDALLEKAEKAKKEKTDLTYKQSTSEKKATKTEKRDVTLRSNITKSEKEKFLKLIGRMSESDAVRLLVIEATKKSKTLS